MTLKNIAMTWSVLLALCVGLTACSEASSALSQVYGPHGWIKSRAPEYRSSTSGASLKLPADLTRDHMRPLFAVPEVRTTVTAETVAPNIAPPNNTALAKTMGVVSNTTTQAVAERMNASDLLIRKPLAVVGKHSTNI